MEAFRVEKYTRNQNGFNKLNSEKHSNTNRISRKNRLFSSCLFRVKRCALLNLVHEMQICVFSLSPSSTVCVFNLVSVWIMPVINSAVLLCIEWIRSMLRTEFRHQKLAGALKHFNLLSLWILLTCCLLFFFIAFGAIIWSSETTNRWMDVISVDFFHFGICER